MQFDFLIADYELRIKSLKETEKSLDRLKEDFSRLEKSTSNLYSALYRYINISMIYGCIDI